MAHVYAAVRDGGPQPARRPCAVPRRRRAAGAAGSRCAGAVADHRRQRPARPPRTRRQQCPRAASARARPPRTGAQRRRGVSGHARAAVARRGGRQRVRVQRRPDRGIAARLRPVPRRADRRGDEPARARPRRRRQPRVRSRRGRAAPHGGRRLRTRAAWRDAFLRRRGGPLRGHALSAHRCQRGRRSRRPAAGRRSRAPRSGRRGGIRRRGHPRHGTHRDAAGHPRLALRARGAGHQPHGAGVARAGRACVRRRDPRGRPDRRPLQRVPRAARRDFRDRARARPRSAGDPVGPHPPRLRLRPRRPADHSGCVVRAAGVGGGPDARRSARHRAAGLDPRDQPHRAPPWPMRLPAASPPCSRARPTMAATTRPAG